MVRLVNRAKMTTATTGTGTITLGTASDGFQTFAGAGVVDGDVVRYVIEEGTAFELGSGVFSSAGDTLTRNPSESSAGGGAITLTGNALVFVGAASEDVQSDVTINGGTIDGTVIGGASAAAGTFTTVTASGDVTIADKIVHSGDTDTAIRFPAANTVTVETAGSERLRINSQGKVGIGTSSPQSELDVFGVSDIIRSTAPDASSNFMAFHDATGRKGFFGYGGATELMTVANERSGDLRFLTSNSVRINITSSGNVGIGNTTPSERLHVTGNIIASGTSSTTKNILRTANGQIEVRVGNVLSFLDTDFTEVTSEVVAVRFFRNTNTTGAKTVRFHRGDGTTSEDARISVGAENTFFGMGGGNVGIGTNSPEAILHVEAPAFNSSDATATAGLFIESQGGTAGNGNFSSGLSFSKINSTRPLASIAAVQTSSDPDQGGVAFFTHSSASSSNVVVEAMRITHTGDVGIGTSSPTAKLHVSADALIHGATVGRGGGGISTNTANGFQALLNNTTGSASTANGFSALLNNTTGVSNTANGRDALLSNTTGANNTANGISALRENTTGANNTANGISALRENTTGTNNIGIGANAGRSTSPRTITTASNEICIGNNSHTGAFIKIAFTVTSDARDKAELAPIPHGLDFVNALQPTEYQFKVGGRDGAADGIRRYGFLAQDVLAAEGDTPVIVNNDDPDSLKMTHDYLIPVLVNAVKELTAQVNDLMAEVAALKGQ